MVTAELATIMPFAVVFALLLLWIVSLGLTQVRLTDAAREGARLVARGEPRSVATEAAEQMAPDDATVHIETVGDTVRVRVASVSSLPLPGVSIGDRRLEAESVAVVEAAP